MRARAPALALALALAVSPAGAVQCLLACAPEAQQAPDAHAHHPLGIETTSVALQPAPHECEHRPDSQMPAAAAPAKAEAGIPLTSVASAASHLEQLGGVVLVWRGTPHGRPAPPGPTLSLSPLRI